ncbi:hypothetical protein BOTCAL_0040g00210 [Botryotinia calthae]|uniref:Uncharacterized protein n=1 Tax=Botryotinia calthae TaxID=38488 RepID=A0A4Y8DCS6_9HELO|nr:hypothetical protein BOTCAL_0040g00210 [Botryotinia calthae]
MAITSTGFDYTEDEDLTVETALYWGLIENGLALIVACLPAVSSGITKPFGRPISTGAQSREGEANFRTEEHFTGDIEAARLRP